MNASVRSRPAARLSARVSSRTESVSTGPPSSSPTGPVSTVLRSGFSGISHVSRNATAMTPAATRKTMCSESVKALAWGSPAFSSAARRPEKIAPSTAVPSEPPIERKSVEPEVATPSMS